MSYGSYGQGYGDPTVQQPGSYGYTQGYGLPLRDELDQGFELDRILTFGERGNILVESFTPGATTVESQVGLNPRGDNRWFGRDRRRPGTWAWSLGVNRQDEVGAYETLAQIQEAWDNEDIRLTPGAVSTLRYRVAGRTRQIYGRARRCEPAPPDIRRFSGYMAVEVDFERVDPLHYDDVESTAVLSIVAAESSGLTEASLKDPLTSLVSPSVQRAGQIFVGGTAATWAVVRIKGATGASNLRVIVDEKWSVGIVGPIASDEVITVDGRPWVRSATSSLGGSASGRLVPTTRLDAMRLTPGPHEIRIEGLDPTGTATATVAWRGASKSL